MKKDKSTDPTRQDLLADIAAAYVMQPLRDGEITVAMLIELEPYLNANQAIKAMKKGVRDGKLAEPVYRIENGRRALAWARKV